MRVFVTALLTILLVPELAIASPWQLSDFELGPAHGEQFEQVIASGDDGFLVAWQDARSGEDIRATRLDGAGNVLDPLGILVWRNPTRSGSRPLRGPDVVWTGSSWLVLIVSGPDFGVARILPERGSLDGPIVWTRFTDYVPYAHMHAVMVGNRVFVAFNTYYGSSFLILDDSGAVVVPPRRLTSDWKGIDPIAASDGTDALLLDFGQQGMVSYRIDRDGVVTGPNALGGPAGPATTNMLATHGQDYVYVRQDFGAVEAWTISRDGRFVLSHAVVSSASDPNPTSPSLALLRGSDGTEILFLAAASAISYEKVIRRATLRLSGIVERPDFGVAERTRRGIRAASSSTLTLVVTAPLRGDYETDLVARKAATIGGIPAAQAYDIATSAPQQRNARAVRNGSDTLVLWQELSESGGSPRIFATRVNGSGPETKPVMLLDLEPNAYAIGGDGAGTYLVARQAGEALQVRRLGRELDWIEPAWRTVENSPGGLVLGESAVAWDGDGWWVGWLRDLGGDPPYDPQRVQRFGRDLQPTTGVVTLGSTPDRASDAPQLVAGAGRLFAFWVYNPDPCYFPICATPRQWLLAVAVDRTGTVVKSETRVAEDVTDSPVAIGWNGSELLAVWPSPVEHEATRITSDLVPLDSRTVDGMLGGAYLESSGDWPMEIGWDGASWVAVYHAFDNAYEPYFGRPTFRRFPASGDPSASWQEGTTRDLGSNDRMQWNGSGRIAAGGGGPTLVIQEIANDETTGVLRYFVRDLSGPWRSRGMRR